MAATTATTTPFFSVSCVGERQGGHAICYKPELQSKINQVWNAPVSTPSVAVVFELENGNEYIITKTSTPASGVSFLVQTRIQSPTSIASLSTVDLVAVGGASVLSPSPFDFQYFDVVVNGGTSPPIRLQSTGQFRLVVVNHFDDDQ
jgi:hypothetical protein